jgi:hypothetical protein
MSIPQDPWNVLAAADFFTVEVWAPRGLVTFYVVFVIELATRRIEIAGITPGPSESWRMQIGRNLTDPLDAASSAIECVQRLGGMLRFYHRAAA